MQKLQFAIQMSAGQKTAVSVLTRCVLHGKLEIYIYTVDVHCNEFE